MAFLEHLNLTVSDPMRTADMLCDLFGWRVRWQGPSINGGLTLHVGSDDSYLAVYSMGGTAKAARTYETIGALNHIGVVVDDLDATEARVRSAGFVPHNHDDYEPGRRFYFHDHDGVEIEVVSYA
nr:VOC family protein [Aliiroseovarius subalbicans]